MSKNFHSPWNKHMTDITLPVGATISGRMSDSSVVQWRARRKGIWYPEDRLRVALPAALFVVPLAVLIFGLCTEYIPGPAGLVVTLLCLFMNGLGVRLKKDPHLRPKLIRSITAFSYRGILYSVHQQPTLWILRTNKAPKPSPHLCQIPFFVFPCTGSSHI